MRVIFSVRHPVDRFESHHKFNYAAYKRKGVGNLNVIAEAVLRPDGDMMKFRNIAELLLMANSEAEKASLEAVLLEVYLRVMRRPGDHNITRHFFDAGAVNQATLNGTPDLLTEQMKLIVMPSFYYPGILHFSKIFGKERILVTPSELFRKDKGMTKHETAARLQREFDRIYRFIGVCPVETISSGDVHTNNKQADVSDRLNVTMRRKMNAFFLPFNVLLDRFIGSSLGYATTEVLV